MNFEIRQFKAEDSKALVKLWKACGLVVPWNDPYRDINRKMKMQPEGFLLGISDGEIIASVMAGYDGHRGWVNYLAVSPDHRHTGLGKRMMDQAELYLRGLGCPKINLQVRSTNKDVIEFYNRIGFKLDDVVSFGKRLDPDDYKDIEA